MKSPIHLHCCPVPGCSTVIPVHFVMCRRHWANVPLDLRTELIRAKHLHLDGALSNGDLERIQDRANAAALGRGAGKGGDR